MRFLLVNLNWPGLVSKKTHKIHFTVPPLDLILLSNFAQSAGHTATICDTFVQGSSVLDQQISEADWVIVATTPYHMWQCPNTEWEWVKVALKRFPQEKLILSGLHASVFPEMTLRETSAAAVMKGEPEGAFISFLRTGNWRETAGVCYLDGDQFISNQAVELPKMDDLVVQSYDVDISRYGYFLLGKSTGVFESSRGCPWKCTFCDQEMFGWKYRTKSPVLFADEVRRAILKTGMKTAYFFDLEFTVSKKRTLEICEELIKADVPKHIRWACQTRADTVGDEVLEALKDAGCSLIHFGVESANPEVLKATNKKITLDKIESGVRRAKEMGFQTACFFMFGLPGENPDQFDTTLEFARTLNPTYASFHFAVPFPGTPLYLQYLNEKNLEWGVWPATYFNDWPHDRILKYLSRAYRKFYLTPKKFEIQEFVARLENLPHKLRYFSSVS